MSINSVEDINQRRNIIMARWLLLVCVMVFAMIVLGGVTRLTQSGLSMVNWHPITGWFPPLNEADWLAEFSNYQQFPEFHEKNFDMDLQGFKSIFWFEFLHRLWGRTIGLAYFIPMVAFFAMGWVHGGLKLKLVVGFVLGGLQGVLGWYMVKSGLVDNPDVSQYRLTAHLGAALVIIGYLIWLALDLLHRPSEQAKGSVGSLSGHAFLVAAWAFVTILSGGFVAGLDAGFTYNTFPLMDGQLIPDGLGQMEPLYINLFENITTVQFNHRILAELLFVIVIFLWWRARKIEVHQSGRVAINLLFGMIWIQVGLGVATLLLVVPVSIAVIHQGGAVVVFCLSLWVAHEANCAKD
ncbi:MAG: COX15/CtaA family protein [Rhodospirillales bacterium]|nr:COX15/CtaA family protein [Rhodospirillales bacterium]